MAANCILCEETYDFITITPTSDLLTINTSYVSSGVFHKALPWQLLLSIRCSTCDSANETMYMACPGCQPGLTDVKERVEMYQCFP